MRKSLLVALLAVSCAMPPDDVGSVREAIVVCPSATTVEGIDVSHWQATIDWDAVAADGIEFAIIRVSHGTGTLDTEFARNWPEARRAGVMRGVYQYFSPGDDPIAQANILIDGIGGALEPGDLPPVLDVEALEGETARTAVANMTIWLDYVEAQLGVRPIIYTAFYFWRDMLGAPDFGAYPLWVANYGVTCPNVPPPWMDFEFWQYSSTGSVAGIAGDCDRNVWNGDLASLMDFAASDPVCGDGVCNGTETPSSCAGDCPTCLSIPPLGRDVDESEICFTRGGPPAYLRDVVAGWNDNLIWTHTTDEATVGNYGVWALTFDEAGLYRVEAYTDAAYAQSTQAMYQVTYAGTTEYSIIDQSAVDGWNLIGEYDFAAGGGQDIRLDDNTGEPLSTNTQMVFDALRFTRLDPPADTDGGIDADAGPITRTDAGPDGTLTVGCGCSAPGRSNTNVPFLLALLALAFVRRRRLERGAKRARVLSARASERRDERGY